MEQAQGGAATSAPKCLPTRDYCVDAVDGRVVVAFPPVELTKAQAVFFAAALVRVADSLPDDAPTFEQALSLLAI